MTEAISLGWNCEAAIRGVALGIRSRKLNGYQTCPFDECITNYDGIIRCISEDFRYFCDPDYLTIVEAEFSTGGIIKGERLVCNTRYGFIFNHESPDHANLHSIQGWPGGPMHYVENGYAKFIERYTRRIQNFRSYVNTCSTIVFLIGKIDPDTSDLESALRKNYPQLEFTIDRFMPDVPVEWFDDHHTLMKNAMR